MVSTLAGGGSPGGNAWGYADGVGSAAYFHYPFGVAIDDSDDFLYVADQYSNVIRAIEIATGIVETLAGGGSADGTAWGNDDGVGSAATFDFPGGIAFGIDGVDAMLYVGDTNNNLIRTVEVATGVVATLAGGGSAGGTANGRADGVGSEATFDGPEGVAVDASGHLYVADYNNHLIRCVDIFAGGYVDTVAGGGGPGGVAAGSSNGIGSSATFSNPIGVAVDGTGDNVYVADEGNNLIRAIVVATGVVSTLAGGGSAGGTAFGNANGVGSAATFNAVSGIAIDGDGSIYVGDNFNNNVRVIAAATGFVTTLAGGGAGEIDAGYADGVGTSALFANPGPLAVDSAGNVFVADNSNSLIRVICPTIPPSASPSASASASRSRSALASSSRTRSASASGSRSRSRAPVLTTSSTSTGTATGTTTRSRSFTRSPAPTPTASGTSTDTRSASATFSDTSTNSPTNTDTPTETITPTKTSTKTASGTRTACVAADGARAPRSSPDSPAAHTQAAPAPRLSCRLPPPRAAQLQNAHAVIDADIHADGDNNLVRAAVAAVPAALFPALAADDRARACRPRAEQTLQR